MRQRLYQFMIGRNGVDELAKAESWLVLGTVILSFFLPGFGLISLVLLIHMYYRVFSRNLVKRRKENQWWLNERYQRVVRRNRRKVRWAQRNVYRYFKCPTCKQQVRVPSGHGKICITCPKCRTEFVKRT